VTKIDRPVNRQMTAEAITYRLIQSQRNRQNTGWDDPVVLVEMAVHDASMEQYNARLSRTVITPDIGDGRLTETTIEAIIRKAKADHGLEGKALLHRRCVVTLKPSNRRDKRPNADFVRLGMLTDEEKDADAPSADSLQELAGG